MEKKVQVDSIVDVLTKYVAIPARTIEEAEVIISALPDVFKNKAKALKWWTHYKSYTCYIPSTKFFGTTQYSNRYHKTFITIEQLITLTQFKPQ